LAKLNAEWSGAKCRNRTFSRANVVAYHLAACVDRIPRDFEDRMAGQCRVKRLVRPAHGESFMTRLRVHGFSISLDGYGAGPDQSLDDPLGIGGEALHDWLVATQTFKRLVGSSGGGNAGADDEFAARGFENIGAWILGRNMFGPIRGPWPDKAWKGWWGDNPPYHTDVFVLTHHAREPIEMEGGTIFHFVTDGVHAALDLAKRSAKDKDVRLGGGASVIRQYLEARLIDEMQISISPVLLGRGEHLFSGVDALALGYACTRHVTTPDATHFVLERR
jgi:dihydrofolate reductase